MTDDSVPTPRTTRADNAQPLMWLLLVLVALGAGWWLLYWAQPTAPDGTPPWTAVAALAIGALGLWLGRRERTSASPTTAPLEPDAGRAGLVLRLSQLPQGASPWRLVLLAAAVLLMLFVLWRIPQMDGQASYTAVTIAWIAAGALFVYAVAPPQEETYPNWRPWLRANRTWLLALGGILLLALLLRVWQLGSIPFTLGGDEGSQGLEALRVIANDLRNPFGTGWLGVPTMSFFFNSLSLRLFGQTIEALRLPWALVGTATVLTTFLLVRQMLGTRLALLAAFLLATYHYHIHFSRLGSNQIADPFFLSLALFLLYRALDRQSRLAWALTGVVTGLAFFFYAGARLTPVVIVVVLGYLFILNPRAFWQRHRVGALIGLGAFLIVAAPMLQYAVRFPDDFNARLNTVGIIQSGWLEREVEIRGQSTVAILFDQFRRAALAFNYYPDRTVWYGLPQPLLDPLFGAVFLLGLIYGLLQLFNRQEGARVAPMVAWWWGGMLLGGMLTESPPSSQRLITLAVPACFFVAYALWETVKLAQTAIGQVPARAALSVAALFFAVISLRTYFVDFTPQRLYGGANAAMATQIAPRLDELKDDNRIYFVGAPWMYWNFATLPYLVTDADAVDIEAPLTESLAAGLMPPERGMLFIVLPPRESELGVLERSFPQGVAEPVYSPVDGRRIVTLYRVPQT